MSDPSQCPTCGRPLKYGGLVLTVREDDGRRTCRALWKCPTRHIWWQWSDRPEAPLEICPVPGLFR